MLTVCQSFPSVMVVSFVVWRPIIVGHGRDVVVVDALKW